MKYELSESARRAIYAPYEAYVNALRQNGRRYKRRSKKFLRWYEDTLEYLLSLYPENVINLERLAWSEGYFKTIEKLANNTAESLPINDLLYKDVTGCILRFYFVTPEEYAKQFDEFFDSKFANRNSLTAIFLSAELFSFIRTYKKLQEFCRTVKEFESDLNTLYDYKKTKVPDTIVNSFSYFLSEYAYFAKGYILRSTTPLSKKKLEEYRTFLINFVRINNKSKFSSICKSLLKFGDLVRDLIKDEVGYQLVDRVVELIEKGKISEEGGVHLLTKIKEEPVEIKEMIYHFLSPEFSDIRKALFDLGYFE